METTISKRRGRKAKHHVTADGTQIQGLAHDTKSGRWRVIATNRFFRAPTEQAAIEKFFDLTDNPAVKQLESKLDDFNRLHVAPKQKAEAAFWARVTKEINERATFVARKTGFEWIAWGAAELKPPKPLPTFAELEQVFRDHFKKSAENKNKVLAAWGHFKKTSGVKDLRDITPEVAVAYRDKIHEVRGSGKSQANIFGRVRRLLTFCKSRAIAVKEISEALMSLSLLVPSETQVSLDPQPIEVDDWKKLYAASDGENRAMILLQLNAAMYCTEVVRLKWSDIRDDGTIITHRAKEGRCVRVCVLWKETLDALKKVERKGEYIFYAYSGAPLGVKGAEARFRKLRKEAKVEHVTSSMLRDGAATAAAEANVNQQLVSLLLGHRTGIADHYVKRRPLMVAPACAAVRAKYIEGKKSQAPKD